MYKINHSYYLLSLLLAAGLLAGCSNDDADTSSEKDHHNIRFNVEAWQIMDGNAATRATTYDSQTALQTGTFVCYAYKDGTTERYIDGSTVSYNGKWAFNDGIHRWPYYALNFFTIMPADLTKTYCTYSSYTEDTPVITCSNLPVAITKGSDDTNELIYAYTPNQDETNQGTNGVTMTFKHPFARVCFKLASASGTNVAINKITISGIYNNGTCTFSGAASPQTSSWVTSGSTTDLVITGSPATGDDTYLVIPQIFASNVTFTVNATWDEWGNNVTKDVSTSVNVGSWQPGYNYTYNFTLSKYILQVDATKYTEQW